MIDIGTEQAVLGSMLIEPGAYRKVRDLIDHDYFHDNRHREIIKAIGQVEDSIDILTVAHQLTKMESLDYIGGTPYLADLAGSIASAANIAAHIDILKENYDKRLFLESAKVTVKSLEDGLFPAGAISQVHSSSGSLLKANKPKPTKKQAEGLKTVDEFALHMQEINEYKYFREHGFYQYLPNNGIWEWIPEVLVEKQILDVMRDTNVEPDPTKINKILKVMSIDCAQREMVHTPNLLIFNNVVVDINNKTTLQHSSEFFCTHSIDLEFPFIGDFTIEQLTGWVYEYGLPMLKFFDEFTSNDRDKRYVIQEASGYCMTNSTKFDTAFFFVGGGSNGKTTFMELLESTVGEKNTSHVNLSGMQSDHQRACLLNKTLNIGTEVEFTNHTSTMIVKQIITGDPINAANKFKPHFDFKPFCKLMFGSNGLPKVTDHSEGWFRRCMVIPCTADFKGAALDRSVKENIRNLRLPFAIWALVGLYRLMENDSFTQCEAINQAIDKYKLESNTLLEFLKESCQLDKSLFIEKGLFMEEYVSFCRKNQYKPLGRKNVSNELRLIGITDEKKRNGHYVYEGVGLNGVMGGI